MNSNLVKSFIFFGCQMSQTICPILSIFSRRGSYLNIELSRETYWIHLDVKFSFTLEQICFGFHFWQDKNQGELIKVIVLYDI